MKSKISVLWKKREDEPFVDKQYSRVHQWRLDGGALLSISSSPQVVPVPMSDASALDPEEAFVGAISSCHMLFFLSLAAAKHYVVDTYEDHATGILSKNQNHQTAMTTINLCPRIVFAGRQIPSDDQIAKLHQLAHQSCFLAHSVKAKINIVQAKKILT